jgi:hypothetical protein
MGLIFSDSSRKPSWPYRRVDDVQRIGVGEKLDEFLLL